MLHACQVGGTSKYTQKWCLCNTYTSNVAVCFLYCPRNASSKQMSILTATTRKATMPCMYYLVQGIGERQSELSSADSKLEQYEKDKWTEKGGEGGRSYLRPTVRPRGRWELAEKQEGPSTSITICTCTCTVSPTTLLIYMSAPHDAQVYEWQAQTMSNSSKLFTQHVCFFV